MGKKIPQILLVDDYEINLELLETYLLHSQMTFQLFKAMNGHDALEIVEKETLDLILLDVMLPDRDGYSICKQVKQMPRYETLPIIMITALHDKDSMMQGLQAGADEFLTKPVDGHELLIRVKNLLKLRQATNDLSNRYHQLQNELALANKLQQSFLPKQPPVTDCLQFELLYKPSGFIGGDFYDFFVISDEEIGVFISDVKGHGVASAMITALLKDNLYKLTAFWPDPQKLFRELNEQLYRFFSHVDNDFFITAFYGVFNLPQKTFTFSNAGHSTPYQGNRSSLTVLDTAVGLPLGIFPGGDYENISINLAFADEILLFTDGIFELNLFGRDLHGSLDLKDIFQIEEEKLSSIHLRLLKQEIQKAVVQEHLPDDVNYIAIKIL